MMCYFVNGKEEKLQVFHGLFRGGKVKNVVDVFNLFFLSYADGA